MGTQCPLSACARSWPSEMMAISNVPKASVPTLILTMECPNGKHHTHHIQHTLLMGADQSTYVSAELRSRRPASAQEQQFGSRKMALRRQSRRWPVGTAGGLVRRNV